MKKRILSLILCGVMSFSLAACGSPAAEPTDSVGTNVVSGTENGTDASADTNLPTDTDSADVSSSGTEGTDSDITDGSSEGSVTDEDSDEFTEDEYEENPDEWDEEDPGEEIFVPDTSGRKLIATDVTQHSIVVFDLDACKGDYTKLTDPFAAVVWEWDSDDDPNCTVYKPGYGLDSAKLRYSDYYKKYVMVACSSNGWVGIIDYENASLIWEYQLPSGPHSVELLPNGDLVVAVSTNSGDGLYYFPLSADVTDPVHSIPSPGAHGVCWDPQKECLWVLENLNVYKVTIQNMGKKSGKLIREKGSDVPVPKGGGHAFTPVYGSPGKYYLGAGIKMFLFDSDAGTLTEDFPRASVLQPKKGIKGLSAFADGTVVICGVKLTNGVSTHTWSCDALRIIDKGAAEDGSQDKITNVTFDVSKREFYKIQPFTANYQ